MHTSRRSTARRRNNRCASDTRGNKTRCTGKHTAGVVLGVNDLTDYNAPGKENGVAAGFQTAQKRRRRQKSRWRQLLIQCVQAARCSRRRGTPASRRRTPLATWRALARKSSGSERGRWQLLPRAGAQLQTRRLLGPRGLSVFFFFFDEGTADRTRARRASSSGARARALRRDCSAEPGPGGGSERGSVCLSAREQTEGEQN